MRYAVKCHLEMRLAGSGPQHNGAKEEKSGGGGRGEGGKVGEPVSIC